MLKLAFSKHFWNCSEILPQHIVTNKAVFYWRLLIVGTSVWPTAMCATNCCAMARAAWASWVQCRRQSVHGMPRAKSSLTARETNVPTQTLWGQSAKEMVCISSSIKKFSASLHKRTEQYKFLKRNASHGISNSWCCIGHTCTRYCMWKTIQEIAWLFVHSRTGTAGPMNIFLQHLTTFLYFLCCVKKWCFIFAVNRFGIGAFSWVHLVGLILACSRQHRRVLLMSKLLATCCSCSFRYSKLLAWCAFVQGLDSWQRVVTVATCGISPKAVVPVRSG